MLWMISHCIYEFLFPFGRDTGIPYTTNALSSSNLWHIIHHCPQIYPQSYWTLLEKSKICIYVMTHILQLTKKNNNQRKPVLKCIVNQNSTKMTQSQAFNISLYVNSGNLFFTFQLCFFHQKMVFFPWTLHIYLSTKVRLLPFSRVDRNQVLCNLLITGSSLTTIKVNLFLFTTHPRRDWAQIKVECWVLCNSFALMWNNDGLILLGIPVFQSN